MLILIYMNLLIIWSSKRSLPVCYLQMTDQKNNKEVYSTQIKTQYHNDRLVGDHTIVIIDWCVENRVENGIIRNSWDPTWADSGFFRMQVN